RIKALFSEPKIWHKLAAIIVVFAVPMAVLAYFLISNNLERINNAKNEAQGIEYLIPVGKLIQHVQQHRVLNSAYANGEGEFRAQVVAKDAQIEEDFRTIDALDKKLGADLKTTEKWASVKARLQQVMHDSPTYTSDQSFQQHTDAVASILELVGLVSET